jgi:hypothetical protein
MLNKLAGIGVALISGEKNGYTLLLDTDTLLHGSNADSPEHRVAYAWLQSVQALKAVTISEFIPAERCCGSVIL